MKAIAAAAAIACAVAACLEPPDVGELLAGQCDPGDSDPEVSISYRLDLLPLFDRPGSEGGCGCHAGSGPGVQLSGLDMSSLASLRRGGAVSGSRIIIPRDPCNSILVQKLSPAPATGARMPLAGPPFFTAEELQRVQDWIAEGALDN